MTIRISMIDKNWCHHIRRYTCSHGWDGMTPEQRQQACEDCLSDFYRRFRGVRIKSVKVECENH